MQGVFYIIQHADHDLDWQSAQLPLIKKAVDQEDLEADNYAYLYDRVQVNAGKPQRYGTQFEDVDYINKTVKLKPVEDLDQLDDTSRSRTDAHCTF